MLTCHQVTTLLARREMLAEQLARADVECAAIRQSLQSGAQTGDAPLDFAFLASHLRPTLAEVEAYRTLVNLIRQARGELALKVSHCEYAPNPSGPNGHTLPSDFVLSTRLRIVRLLGQITFGPANRFNLDARAQLHYDRPSMDQLATSSIEPGGIECTAGMGETPWKVGQPIELRNPANQIWGNQLPVVHFDLIIGTDAVYDWLRQRGFTLAPALTSLGFAELAPAAT